MPEPSLLFAAEHELAAPSALTPVKASKPNFYIVPPISSSLSGSSREPMIARSRGFAVPGLYAPMNSPLPSQREDVFQMWRVADRQARALETALTRSLLAALDGQGVFPSQELCELAQQLRHAANDLFAVAMKEMARRADLNRYGYEANGGRPAAM